MRERERETKLRLIYITKFKFCMLREAVRRQPTITTIDQLTKKNGNKRKEVEIRKEKKGGKTATTTGNSTIFALSLLTCSQMLFEACNCKRIYSYAFVIYVILQSENQMVNNRYKLLLTTF